MTLDRGGRQRGDFGGVGSSDSQLDKEVGYSEIPRDRVNWCYVSFICFLLCPEGKNLQYFYKPHPARAPECGH